jgi:hypothetical protein
MKIEPTRRPGDGHSPPIRASPKTWTAINAAVAAARSANQNDDDRTWDQLQADVVVDLLTATGANGVDRRVPEVSVLIDERTLRDGIHRRSTCETSDGQQLPVATLRRLCCDGYLVPIVLGGDGEVLDVGRQCRLATRAQRRALRAMYRTCAHPDCSVPVDACRIHHVIHWERGGRTDLANMLPLCERHHHHVHEGGWTLQLFPDRCTIWRTPNGSAYHDGITTDRTQRTPTTGGRQQRCRSDRASEVAAELEHALTSVLSRSPP